jgi:hypothetical protein
VAGFFASGSDFRPPCASRGSMGLYVNPSPPERTWAKRAATGANPWPARNSRNSPDQSASAKHSP